MSVISTLLPVPIVVSTSRIVKKEIISALADMISFGISLIPFAAGG